MIHLYKFKYKTFLILFLLLLSCEKMIEIDNPNNQIGREEIFKDIQTTKSALSNLYSSMRSSSMFSGSSIGLGTILSLYTDELESLSNNNTLGYQELYNNTINANLAAINYIWSSSYTNIYSINAFLEGVSNSTFISDEDKKKFISQAIFLRCLYFHYLTQLYGDIPYITSTDYKYNTTIKKTPFLNVLKNIENDLLSIENDFDYKYNDLNKIYPNKASVELLLAKNFLLQKDYNNAQKYAQKIIDNPLYELEKDILSTFKKTAKSTLWQFSPNNPTDATAESDNYIILSNPNYQLNKNFIIEFFNKDLRKKHWISSANINNINYIYANKYKNRVPNNDELSIVFRIEEAYFILIEALAYQGETSKSIEFLNTILKKRGLDALPPALSQNELIDVMLAESKKEFFCEFGHRFFDLKRNNKLNDLKTEKVNWKSFHALFPYPEKEILINPNLLPQNNGY